MLKLSNLVSGVVDIAPVEEYPVEALCWDITLGTAGTGFGQYILEKTSSSSDAAPEAIDHVGIVVFGYLYEYGDLGILKTAAPLQSNPASKYPVFTLRSREEVGKTKISQNEFENWVEKMNQTDFRGSNYDVVTTSCVVWGIKACEFLGVQHPENWTKICDWATENSKVAGIIGGSGIHSRKVQLRAQAAQCAQGPKKFVNYLKKKFCRKKGSQQESKNEPTVETSKSRDSEGTGNISGSSESDKGNNSTNNDHEADKSDSDDGTPCS